MAAAQPTDVLEFLCWLDACGERRRTIVHDIDCEAVGTDELLESCKEKELCGKRFAHDSLRTNYVSKLAVAYERDLGVAPVWCDELRVRESSKKRSSDPVYGVYEIRTKTGRSEGETGTGTLTRPSCGYHSTNEGTTPGYARLSRKGSDST